MGKTKKQIILDTISDLMTDFFYYDRKEDDELPVGAIEKAVEDKEITVEEIKNAFQNIIMNKF